MKLVIDSSSLLKRYVKEPGTRQLNTLIEQTTRLAVCCITVPEILSGMNRRVREKSISNDEYTTIKTQLMNDICDVIILQITPSITALSIHLLEKNVLRTMDAIHIACALEWEAELFVTSDARQLIAARNSGLVTKYIGR